MKPGNFKKTLNKKKSLISRNPVTGKLKQVKELSILKKERTTLKRDNARTKRQLKIVEEKLDTILNTNLRERVSNIVKTKIGTYRVADALYYPALLEAYRSYLKINKKLANQLTKADVEKIKVILIENLKKKQKYEKIWN